MEADRAAAPRPDREAAAREARDGPGDGGAVAGRRGGPRPGPGKAGGPMLRKHLVQMAWRWLHHQPHGALSGWSVQYVSARDGRPGRRGIVALARRLLVALWRFATTGLAHGGAVLSKAPA